jgi:glycosyltransferase involved in cell wall biosynthesis
MTLQRVLLTSLKRGIYVTKRYVGARQGNIYIVSSSPIASDDPNVSVAEVPLEHAHLTASKLVTGFRVKRGKMQQRQRKATAKTMKLALVGNWKMQCGIATYSEKLWPEVAKHVGDFRLFIEKNDQPTSPTNVIGDIAIPPERVIPCWKRGEPLGELVKAIKEYEPDVVHIQHEFGIWPNAGYWLSLMSQLNDYRVFVTLHSVFHHRDKTIVEAAIPNIIVHLEGAKSVLKDEKCVPGNVFVIPHGCSPIVNNERLWNFYKSEHTLIQWGFGFKYKNWETSLEVTHLLKKKYPDVFYTGLFSESPFNMIDHQVYYDELMRLVEKLDLMNNVAIIRGYQSDVSLDSYLRTNKVAIFPYVSTVQHEVFGASGAARYAMTKLLPIVTSNVNHFSDLPTLKGDSPQQLADAIDQMFSNPLAYKQQVDCQVDYVNANSWENVGARHVEIYSR